MREPDLGGDRFAHRPESGRAAALRRPPNRCRSFALRVPGAAGAMRAWLRVLRFSALSVFSESPCLCGGFVFFDFVIFVLSW